MDTKINKLYKKINNDDVDLIVFGLSTCSYCKKTLELLRNNKISYKYYTIDEYYNTFFQVFIEIAKKYPEFNINENHKTVPVIFYKKSFLGGYSELSKLLH
jgi:glutaredoxin